MTPLYLTKHLIVLHVHQLPGQGEMGPAVATPQIAVGTMQNLFLQKINPAQPIAPTWTQ